MSTDEELYSPSVIFIRYQSYQLPSGNLPVLSEDDFHFLQTVHKIRAANILRAICDVNKQNESEIAIIDF